MGSISFDVGALEDLPEAREQLEKIAHAILDEAKANCPVDTGTLRASGKVEEGGDSFTVSFSTEYAAYVHEGTYKMAANPFLRRAAMKYRG